MKKLTTGRDADESSLSHTKWNCMYHIVFIFFFYAINVTKIRSVHFI